MPTYPAPLSRLIEELQRLPGIGPKSAQRLAFHILRAPREEAEALAAAIRDVQERIRSCRICFNYTDGEVCAICADERRDHALICVVGQPSDVMALERMGEYRGVYHVLQGLLSALDGVGPADIRARELVERVRAGGVRELILATSPTPEGEATAAYIRELMQDTGVRVTRIGFGIPVGGDLDYADQVTIARAIEGRREM
jgi:recombination protein RecR